MRKVYINSNFGEAHKGEREEIMKSRNFVPYILLIVVGLMMNACASSPYPPHAQHRGSENWGAVLGYTTAELRGMTPEQYKQAYIKSKMAADANADWADSESRWYVTGQKKRDASITGQWTKELVKQTGKVGKGAIQGAVGTFGQELKKTLRDSVKDAFD